MKKGRVLAGFFGFIVTIVVTIFPEDIRTAIVGEEQKDKVVKTEKVENPKKEIQKKEDSPIIKVKTPEKEKKKQPTSPKINIIAVKHLNQPEIKEIAIVIKNKNNTYSNLSSSIANLYSQKNATQGIPNLFNSNFLKLYFDPIYSGNTANTLNEKIDKYVDEFLIGTITFNESVNDRDLHLTRASFKANLYNAKDFRLIKTLQVRSKGLNFDQSLSKEQAIDELMQQLKKEI